MIAKPIRQSYSKPVAYVLMLALFLNVLAPLVFVFAHPAKAEAGALFGDKILICTASGYKYISLKDLQNNDTSKKHQSDPQCSLCVVSMSMAAKLLPVLPVATLQYVRKAEAYYDTALHVALTGHATGNAYPRAPPSFL